MEVSIDMEKTRRRCRDKLNKTDSAEEIVAVAQVLGVPIEEVIPASEIALADALQLLRELRDGGPLPPCQDLDYMTRVRTRIYAFTARINKDAFPERFECYQLVFKKGGYLTPRMFLTRQAAQLFAQKFTNDASYYEILPRHCSVWGMRDTLKEVEQSSYPLDKTELEALENLKAIIY